MIKKTFGLFFPSPSHGSPRLGTDPRRNVGQGEREQCEVGVAKGREGPRSLDKQGLGSRPSLLERSWTLQHRSGTSTLCMVQRGADDPHAPLTCPGGASVSGAEVISS